MSGGDAETEQIPELLPAQVRIVDQQFSAHSVKPVLHGDNLLEFGRTRSFNSGFFIVNPRRIGGAGRYEYRAKETGDSGQYSAVLNRAF